MREQAATEALQHAHAEAHRKALAEIALATKRAVEQLRSIPSSDGSAHESVRALRQYVQVDSP